MKREEDEMDSMMPIQHIDDEEQLLT